MASLKIKNVFIDYTHFVLCIRHNFRICYLYCLEWSILKSEVSNAPVHEDNICWCGLIRNRLSSMSTVNSWPWRFLCVTNIFLSNRRLTCRMNQIKNQRCFTSSQNILLQQNRGYYTITMTNDSCVLLFSSNLSIWLLLWRIIAADTRNRLHDIALFTCYLHD